MTSMLLAFSVPDVVLLCVLLLFFLIGVTRGFVRSIVSFFGTFVAIALAVALTVPFSKLLGSTFGLTAKFGAMFEGFLPKLSSVFSVDVGGFTIEQATAAVKLPGFIEKALMKNAVSGVLPQGTTVAQLAAPVFGGYLCSVTSFICLFIVIKVLLLLLSHFFKKIDNVPLLGGLNKILGGVFGLLRGLLFTFSILAVISFLPAKWMRKPISSIQSSAITSAFYENNLLVLAVGGTLDGNSIQKLLGEIVK